VATWVRVEPPALYRGEMEKRGAPHSVLRTYLCFVRGQVNLVNQRERAFDPLERFVIRCLLELRPVPTYRQIASLLGFEDERFVSAVLHRLQENEYLAEKAPGAWVANSRLKEDFARGQWVVEKAKLNIEFRYEWVTKTFLPEHVRPETWEGARLLPAVSIEIDEEIRTQWAKGVFGKDAGDTIRWESHEPEKIEQWMSPLQVFVYQADGPRLEWDVFEPETGMPNTELRPVAEKLGVQEECMHLAGTSGQGDRQ
jgi:alkylated DNA nucleotide flippase Atl1